MSTVKLCLCISILGLAAASPIARAQGGLRLEQQAEAAAYAAHWQARFGLAPVASVASEESGRWQPSAGRLLGDYYWSGIRPAPFGMAGGFRATSGLLVGERSMALGAPMIAPLNGVANTVARNSSGAPRFGESVPQAWSAVPYIGIGYSGMSLKGGWGFTADVGLAGTSGGLRTRREAAPSSQNIDELLRELRLSPVLQFGASYAF